MSDLVHKLVGALEDCLDDSHQVLAQIEQMYGMNYRQDRLEAQRKTIADAEAALSAAKDGGWLPIETAPKDGRRVLVWIDDKHLARENRQIHFAKLWFYEDGRLGGGAEGFNGKWNITKWQPLPNPPKEQA